MTKKKPRARTFKVWALVVNSRQIADVGMGSLEEAECKFGPLWPGERVEAATLTIDPPKKRRTGK